MTFDLKNIVHTLLALQALFEGAIRSEYARLKCISSDEFLAPTASLKDFGLYRLCSVYSCSLYRCAVMTYLFTTVGPQSQKSQ